MHKFYSILFFLLFGVVALCAKPQVIFIHGWQVIPSDFSLAQAHLEIIFPDYEIHFWKWNAEDINFSIAQQYADASAKDLADSVTKMSPADRKELILVGHSLGGLLAVKAMSYLANQKLKIDRGIFLGAAIPDNDPAIAEAITASQRSNINVYNPQDHLLRDIYGTFNLYQNQRMFALGAFGYANPCLKTSLFQIQAAEYINDYSMLTYINHTAKTHLLSHYLTCLKDNIHSADQAKQGEIDRSTADHIITIPSILFTWNLVIPRPIRLLLKEKTMASYNQWLLVSFYSPPRQVGFGKLTTSTPAFNVYCVLDPRARIVGWTKQEELALRAFEEIKKQLQNP